MAYRIAQWLALLALSTLNPQLTTVFAQGTAFNYQDRLNDGTNSANGIYDLLFTIYDSTTSPGNIIAGPLTNLATVVSDGWFSVTLDFGAGVFNGPALWLEVDARTNGGGSFATLLPRQPMLPVPYAIMANTASNLLGTLPAAQLSGTLPSSALAGYSGVVAFTDSANTFVGAFTGNGSGLTNVNAATAATATNANNLLVVVGGTNLSLIPNVNAFTQTLVIGNGGLLLNTRGLNPVDPQRNELNGSQNAQFNTFIGINAGLSDTSGNMNVFVGSQAGQNNVNGDQNTFIGQQAGINNTSGYHNTFVGEDAGQGNTTGFENTIVGTDAGLNASAGSYNTFVGGESGNVNTGSKNSFFGMDSGESNTSGSYSSFLGFDAGTSVTTGGWNTFAGAESGLETTIGSNSVAVGTYSLLYNVKGNNNSAVGMSALYNATNSQNTALGYDAGLTLISGTNNTFLGSSADVTSSAEFDYVSVIGAGAKATASHQIMVGTSSETVVTPGAFTPADIQSITNAWTVNTPIAIGMTNGVCTSGAATIGITGVANMPSANADYGAIHLTANGVITFTNPVSFHCSDFVSFRTISNRNVAEIVVHLIPGVSTNLFIVQCK